MKMRSTLSRFAEPALLFILFFAGMAVIQFASPDLPDNDGFYHIKMAWLMRTQGLIPDFPWLPLSILNPREFYDHHFLFHVALIPFTFGDLLTGAKWAAVTYAAVAYLLVWYLFKSQRLPFAWLWALALLGISDAFLYRMSITRAQSLSLGILALGMVWMLQGKYLRLALLAFAYVWFYDAFPLMGILAVVYTVALLISERRLDLRPLLYVGVGTALGMLVNPYFPFNIIFAYRHILPKLTDATSTNVGNEWYPYNTGQLLDNSLPALVAFASGILALGLSGRKMDLRTTFGLLTALLFGLMLFQARRFVEYFPAFGLIFAAFAWAPFFENAQPVNFKTFSRQSTLPDLLRLLPVALLGVSVLGGVILSVPAVQESLRGSKPADLYSGAAQWLAENTPQGERVFQTDWDDFPRLFFYNTHNTYLVGLDPTYLELFDADLYSEWVQVTGGDIENPSQTILETFGARYVHSDLNHRDFLRRVAKDPAFVKVYEDNQAVIFEIVTDQNQ